MPGGLLGVLAVREKEARWIGRIGNLERANIDSSEVVLQACERCFGSSATGGIQRTAEPLCIETKNDAEAIAALFDAGHGRVLSKGDGKASDTRPTLNQGCPQFVPS